MPRNGGSMPKLRGPWLVWGCPMWGGVPGRRGAGGCAGRRGTPSRGAGLGPCTAAPAAGHGPGAPPAPGMGGHSVGSAWGAGIMAVHAKQPPLNSLLPSKVPTT